jgi:hypothetical protein
MENNQVLWSNLSLCDTENRVFEFNNVFFRGVFKKDSTVMDFLYSDLYKELYKLGSIPKTEISEFQHDKFEVVLKHETASFITYPHEWSYQMFKDACLLYLNIFEIATKHGYHLKDGHPYNIVFFNNKPKFVDIGSFIKSENNVNLDEFNRTMLVPLLIWSKGYYNVALNIISDDRSKLSLKDGLKVYFGINFYERPGLRFLKKIYSYRKQEEKVIVNSDLKSKIRFIKELMVKQNTTAWGNYHSEYHDGNQIKSTPRFDKIIYYINQFNDIKSVYDIACNQGIVSKLISKECLSVTKLISTDYDEKAIDYFYETANNYDNITIGVSDLICPISNFQEKPLVDRFRSDCVLVLALLHHLILGQKIHLDIILNRLKSLSNKYLFIEFMPLGLWGGEGYVYPEIPEFYTLEWFVENLSNHFIILKEEELETNRILFICTIKE